MAQDDKTLDLIAIGRAGVDLYGQQVGGRLEDMASFAKYVGGSPTNTAIGAARLGLRCALLTRVGADPMGRFIRETLEREGVDTGAVIVDPGRLTALVLLGIRATERFPLVFYRQDCADMALCEDDVEASFIDRAHSVVLSGTHFSTPGVRAASLKAARLARAGGARVVLDVDYRPVLWGVTALELGEQRFVADPRVTTVLQEVLPLCDLIVGTEEEMHILGGANDTVAALKALRSATDALLVCKRGPMGCSAFAGAIPESLDEGVVGPGFPVEVFNILGAGDAFMAGFLRGWLRDAPLERCCELANAAGAIVVSRHGCAPAMPSWLEMEAFLAGPNRPRRLREDADLEHVHWAANRRGHYDSLMVLAIDHRSQFIEMAQAAGADPARIGIFKMLALDAVDRLAQGDRRFGVLLDGRFGSEALARAADFPYWIGRPIEAPGSRPLAFEGSADVGCELTTWPANQVVKCLVRYHPDDAADLRERQDRQLVRLFDACRATGHELLLEIIAPAGMAIDAVTTARALRNVYGLGVRPDWWKLEPAADAATWRNIAAAIEENDPLCRGVLILGLSGSSEALRVSFRAAAGVGIVKGFAVGRTIFGEVAEAWLRGSIDDEAATAALAERFAALGEAWRAARANGKQAA